YVNEGGLIVLKAAASLLAISWTVGAAAETPGTDAPTPSVATPAAPPAPATSAPAPDLELNEIIVTAQRRTERLVDVPISIATLSHEEIERAGATSLESLNKLIP